MGNGPEGQGPDLSRGNRVRHGSEQPNRGLPVLVGVRDGEGPRGPGSRRRVDPSGLASRFRPFGGGSEAHFPSPLTAAGESGDVLPCGLRIHTLTIVQMDFLNRTSVVPAGSLDRDNPTAPVQAAAKDAVLPQPRHGRPPQPPRTRHLLLGQPTFRGPDAPRDHADWRRADPPRHGAGSQRLTHPDARGRFPSPAFPTNASASSP